MVFNKKNIYIFDFDGTIIPNDSFLLFTNYTTTIIEYLYYWIYVFFNFLFHSKSKLKERFFLKFNGLDVFSFNKISFSFFKNCISNKIYYSFHEYLIEIKKGSKIVVVSASISNYLKPWCDEMGFDLICTELEVKDGKLTGRFSTPNCNGKEKVRRINEKYDLSSYDEIHVFGNSKGDFPMLELGTHKYYKFFK